MNAVTITHIGGPTALIEMGGFRLLTDPTFDPPGDYPLPHVTLKKTSGPSRSAAEVGHADAVLLSHDQHADNLDTSGRAFLTASATRVLTTRAGAGRLGKNAEGMAPWDTVTLTHPAGGSLTVTATPARHGPAGIEPLAGVVIGFVLAMPACPTIYITGDTVWYEGVAEVARRFSPELVLLFAGAARTRGPFHLTMDVNDALEAAHGFPNATIVPVHYEGWAHFSQGRADLEQSFKALGVESRLRVLDLGVPTPL
jgi:L-ascorbate metabolism protein UlaG (beta-lactamase superfamily)